VITLILAIIACRNEEEYLGNCLGHLVSQGISLAIIDNASSDGSKETLARPDIRDALVHYEIFPWDGTYRWLPILQRKVAIAESLKPEWVIHCDADEIMHSTRTGESLADAIYRIGKSGADVLNFDEFVMLPLRENYFRDLTGPQPILEYYFFEPNPKRLMRVWRPGHGLSMAESGGHIIKGATVASESLVLRHYLFRNQQHAYEKYSTRIFDSSELAGGWHGNRYRQPVERFEFPALDMLKTLATPDSREFDKTDVKKLHYWQW
jgi:glycosyltransferase involved in cell wall biosynthesis